jgi:hypothetical protein
MNEIDKLNFLEKSRQDLEPEVKKWNQNRLFLSWGITATFTISIGLEMLKMWYFDFNHKFNFNLMIGNYYFVSLFILFAFFFILCLKISKMIDTKANDLQKLYNQFSKEINKIEQPIKYGH